MIKDLDIYMETFELAFRTAAWANPPLKTVTMNNKQYTMLESMQNETGEVYSNCEVGAKFYLSADRECLILSPAISWDQNGDAYTLP